MSAARKTELVPPKNSLVIVIRMPITLKAFNRIIGAIGVGFPKSAVQVAPPYSSVQVDGWLIEVGGEDG